METTDGLGFRGMEVPRKGGHLQVLDVHVHGLMLKLKMLL